MKGFSLIFLILFLISGSLYAAGGQESDVVGNPLNSEFTVVITAPDVSALPYERQIIENTVLRFLVDILEGINYRIREEDEITFYKEDAWRRSREGVVRSLLARRNERDLVIYRGDPEWRARNSLRTIDEAIERLEAELAVIEDNPPLIESSPVFRLSGTNLSGTYPLPPPLGDEITFLNRQRADAFITLDLSEFHERIFLNIKMYTLHTASYSYEDFVLFSTNDIYAAMNEIGGRLAGVISGTSPAMLIVNAMPPEAIVHIDNRFAGVGAAEQIAYSPGEVEVSIYAENHLPARFTMELMPGQITEMSFDLTPLGTSTFELDAPGSPGSRLYLGNLYIGETPISLDLPQYQFSYINVESPELETSSVIFRNNEIVSGRADFQRTNEGGNLSFSNLMLPEENRMENARQSFYRTYGAFWIVLPVSLLTAGIAGSYIQAHNYVLATNPGRSDYNEIYRRAETARYIQLGANAVWITGLGLTLFQIYRYLSATGAEAEPNVRAPSQEEETEE